MYISTKFYYLNLKKNSNCQVRIQQKKLLNLLLTDKLSNLI